MVFGTAFWNQISVSNTSNIMQAWLQGQKQKDPENLATPQMEEDPIVAMIGKMGRWQAIRIAICWLISMPGMCHHWAVAFETIVPPFQCADDTVPGNMSNHCAAECDEYNFDTSFWGNTIPMEFGLICDRFNLLSKYLFIHYYLVTFPLLSCYSIG